MPTWSNTKQILFKLLGENTPIVIYTPSEVPSKDVPAGTKFNGYITDLRVKSKVYSLEETPLPEFELGQSKTQKLAVIRDLEYLQPHYYIELLIREKDAEWLPIFEFAIHNRRPFFVTELLGYLTRNPAYAIAPNVELGIVFKDDGYGYPWDSDQIILFGLAREEYSIPDPPIIIQSVLPATPTEDIEMADLTATVITPVLSDSAYDSTTIEYTYSNGKAYRLLVWPALKLAKLDFVFNISQPNDEAVLMTWDAAYTCDIPKLLFNPTFYEFSSSFVPNAWLEIVGNSLIFRANTYFYSDGSDFRNNMSGDIAGSITFSIQ